MTKNNHNGENLTVFDNNDGTFRITLVSKGRVFRINNMMYLLKENFIKSFDKGLWTIYQFNARNGMSIEVQEMWARYSDVIVDHTSNPLGTLHFLDKHLLTRDQINIYYDIMEEKGIK